MKTSCRAIGIAGSLLPGRFLPRHTATAREGNRRRNVHWTILCRGIIIAEIVSSLIEREMIMEIDELKIEMEHWGENKGKYIAKVCLRDGKNELSIVMNPDISARLLPLVVDELCNAAADYANELRRKLSKETNPQNVPKGIEHEQA